MRVVDQVRRLRFQWGYGRAASYASLSMRRDGFNSRYPRQNLTPHSLTGQNPRFLISQSPFESGWGDHLVHRSNTKNEKSPTES